MIAVKNTTRLEPRIVHGREVGMPDYLADQVAGMSPIPHIPPGYKLRRILHDDGDRRLEVDFYVPAEFQGFVHLKECRLIAWVLPDRSQKLTMFSQEASEFVNQIKDVVAQEYQNVEPSKYSWNIRLRKHSAPYGGSTRRVIDVNFPQPIATLCGSPDNWIALANRISRIMQRKAR